MPLRIGFDMDGVLADFGAAFHEVERQLFGTGTAINEGQPEQEAEQQGAASAPDRMAATADPSAPFHAVREARRRRDQIWQAIQSTPNFWRALQPTDRLAVPRIHDLMIRYRWEVFFITQRPSTEGDTVQRQTQQWLVEQGFDLPSVLVLAGPRGAAVRALRLDYHVDDSAQNCLDVVADSRAKPILIVPDGDAVTIASARNLGIGTAQSIAECLGILEQATLAQTQPTVLARLASLVGWK